MAPEMRIDDLCLWTAAIVLGAAAMVRMPWRLVSWYSPPTTRPPPAE
jgi:hypothetical protein